MLKVNNTKGKFDIVLNEDNLFKTEAKDRVVKGRQSSKGFSTKTSQAHTLPPKTNRLKKDDKTKSIPKLQKKDVNDARLTKNTRKAQATKDASFVTKDQLSRILSSLTSADTQVPDSHSPPDQRQHSQMESAAQQTAVYQPLTRGSQERTIVHASESKAKENTHEGTDVNQVQVNSSEKNFQWKKELDEQMALKQMQKAQRHLSLLKENEVEEYDPWGRPGGGAPIRTQSGTVVADYKKRHQGISSKNDENVTSVPPAFNISSKMMTTTESCTTHDVITTETPVAMRSSFAVGAPGVVKYESYQSKIDEKKKWLQDIEQQIKEKKERQAQEKLSLLRKEAIEESWNQRPVVSNESSPGPTITATKPESPFNVRDSVAPESSFRAGNVHVRGHGLHSLGDVNQDEFDRKRLKTLEHQRAIKEQVEEKRRLKQEEKERRLKDEAEKEKALTLERERLQNQYKEELQLREDKEDEARRRAEALQLSILQAHESAQQEKAAKRIKHLELGGHDVTGLKSPGLGGIVHQHTAADTSDHNKETELSSPRISQHNETDDIVSSLTHQKNALFKSELKEISLNASLESEWTTSSPVSSARNNSQAKSHLKSSPSPGKDTGYTTTRSHSERSQRKKQTFKQRNKRQASLENIKHGRDSHPNKGTENMSPVPAKDGFMIPYTRTTSATFHAVPDTPLSHPQADLTAVNRTKPTLKKPQSVVIPPAYRTTNQPALGRHTVRKDNMIEKPTGPTGRQGMVKQGSKKTAEIRKVKHDKTQEENPHVYPVQASPDRVPTARQEMILQQLAALRQGLMMKEQELHHGAL